MMSRTKVVSINCINGRRCEFSGLVMRFLSLNRIEFGNDIPDLIICVHWCVTLSDGLL